MSCCGYSGGLVPTPPARRSSDQVPLLFGQEATRPSEQYGCHCGQNETVVSETQRTKNHFRHHVHWRDDVQKANADGKKTCS